MKARVTVRLKPKVLDPQGQAVLHAAQSLGFSQIQELRMGKIFDIEIDSKPGDEIEKKIEKLADQLLANTVIENYQVEIIES